MSELLPCPFCGFPGELKGHGYSDDYCAVGCSNDNCEVGPSACVSPDCKAWNPGNPNTTYQVLWPEAEAKAAEIWNKRATTSLPTPSPQP